MAAGKGHTDVVEVLVKAGADVNKVSYVHVHVGCEEVLHVHVHVEEHVLLYPCHVHCVVNLYYHTCNQCISAFFIYVNPTHTLKEVLYAC